LLFPLVVQTGVATKSTIAHLADVIFAFVSTWQSIDSGVDILLPQTQQFTTLSLSFGNVLLGGGAIPIHISVDYRIITSAVPPCSVAPIRAGTSAEISFGFRK
jgi:hypothetical protein